MSACETAAQAGRLNRGPAIEGPENVLRVPRRDRRPLSPRSGALSDSRGCEAPFVMLTLLVPSLPLAMRVAQWAHREGAFNQEIPSQTNLLAPKTLPRDSPAGPRGDLPRERIRPRRRGI
ncbi:hypothetical protein SKAU_G00304680 [Synaphobranchus kaupii]|uniref:Uncharacterized protein n=1 Tax=Synaphobranchus kaupii TaxID=118154 RepID=A0A9Q1EWE0_SYNKA|nr:hypothetical protein SKAU_G00304680 [Synaphobranchus kaupii]